MFKYLETGVFSCLGLNYSGGPIPIFSCSMVGRKALRALFHILMGLNGPLMAWQLAVA
jgi:hypothetical protein